MTKTILYIGNQAVTKQALPTTLRSEYAIECVKTYDQARKKLNGMANCCLALVEYRAAGVSCERFLKSIKAAHPYLVRTLLVPGDKFDSASKAIKAAQIFHIQNPPCPDALLQEIIRKGIQQYEMQRGRQKTMRKTLLGSVRAMVDILDMVSPEAMGFAKRIRKRVLDTGRALGFKPLWRLELAVMLSHIGCIALPAEIMLKVDQSIPLTPEEEQMFAMHPNIAATLLTNIPKMASVATIIRHQNDCLSDEQPLGSRIIKVALDLDRMERQGGNVCSGLESMCTEPEKYDQRVVECMQKLTENISYQNIKEIDVEDLKVGMIMARDLVNKDGAKLLLKGQPVSKASLNRLKAFHIALGIMDPIHIVEKD